MGDWNTILDEYLTESSLNFATAAGLGNISDYNFYAASPSAGEAGWGKHVYKFLFPKPNSIYF